MTTAKSIASNFTIQLVGKALSVLLGLASIAILTRYLGTQAFGEYTTALTYLQLFGVVVDFGLTLTLIVLISKQDADEERVVGNFLGLRLVSGFLLFSLAPLTVLFFSWGETVNKAVLVGAFAYLLMGGASMLVGVFQRHESMWRAAVAELCNRIVLLGLIALLVWQGAGLIALVAAAIAANAVWLVMIIWFAKPFLRIFPRFEWSQWWMILSQSWPIAVSIIFNLLYLKGDILFLALLRDQTDVGLYGMAYRIIDVVTVIPMMLMGLVLPSLVDLWHRKETQLFATRVARLFDLFMMTAIPIILGAQLVGRELIVLIAGEAFAPAGDILRWLILAILGVFLGTLFGHLIVALNKQRGMTFGYIAVALVSLIVYTVLIPPYGIMGAIAGTLFSELAVAIITFVVVIRTSHVRINLHASVKALLASIPMLIVLTLLQGLPVILLVLIGMIVYAAALLSLRAITPQELRSLLPTR